jgi:hypothetical protein
MQQFGLNRYLPRMVKKRNGDRNGDKKTNGRTIIHKYFLSRSSIELTSAGDDESDKPPNFLAAS